jgi:hypothetical protein
VRLSVLKRASGLAETNVNVDELTSPHIYLKISRLIESPGFRVQASSDVNTMDTLPTDSSLPLQKPTGWPNWRTVALLACLTLFTIPYLGESVFEVGTANWIQSGIGGGHPSAAVCPAQPKALVPKMEFKYDDEYKRHSAGLLSAAVVSSVFIYPSLESCLIMCLGEQQIPTVSFDDMGKPQEDARWKPFFEFKDWLTKTFPLV